VRGQRQRLRWRRQRRVRWRQLRRRRRQRRRRQRERRRLRWRGGAVRRVVHRGAVVCACARDAAAIIQQPSPDQRALPWRCRTARGRPQAQAGPLPGTAPGARAPTAGGCQQDTQPGHACPPGRGTRGCRCRGSGHEGASHPPRVLATALADCPPGQASRQLESQLRLTSEAPQDVLSWRRSPLVWGVATTPKTGQV